MKLMGYRRKDGGVGFRNHVVVISSVSCANAVVDAIGRVLPDIKTITHAEGCGRGPVDMTLTYRTMLGLCTHPNVAAVLVVGLGCEFIPAPGLAQNIAEQKKRVEHIVMQEVGGSAQAIQKGIEIAGELLKYAGSLKREECGWDEFILGLECGGSDALSGITANPLAGSVSDRVVGQGGTAMISETTEMIGTAHILARRSATLAIAEQIEDLIARQNKKVHDTLGDMAHMVISPGNVEGGLSNIVEKSLGCIVKGGTTPLNEVLEYACRPTKKGFVIMDSPGSDIFSITGMSAGGTHAIIFTTGRGSCTGFPTVPVIKIASNTSLYERMTGDMDYNAARVLEEISMEEATDEVFRLLGEVLCGEPTRAEINRQDILSIMTLTEPF
jgi:altronate dehydratase large subunit